MRVLDSGLAVLEPTQDRVLSRWVERDGSLDGYDWRIRQLLAPMIPEGGYVIDGGAFLGSHTTVYADRVGPMGRVFAFEPMPSHVECLRYNVRHQMNVVVMPEALYSSAVTLCLTPNCINAGATVVGDGGRDSVEVEAVALDSFEFPRLDFIKLDIEGLVLHALEGAQRTIRYHRPTIVAELGDNLALFGDFPLDVIGFMTLRGYVFSVLPPIEGTENTPDQYDVLFTPKERAG